MADILTSERTPNARREKFRILGTRTGKSIPDTFWIPHIYPKLRDIIIAIRIYTALIKDLETQDPEVKYPDSCELLEFIDNMVKGPMTDLLRVAQAQEHLPPECIKDLSVGIGNINSRLTTMSEKVRKNLSKELGSSADLTPLSPLELIIRIVARKKQPKTLNDYQQHLESLNITKQCRHPFQDLDQVTATSGTSQPRASPAKSWAAKAAAPAPPVIKDLPAVPKVIFICIDETGASSPRHIITTSPDSWPNITCLYEWGKQARIQRMEDYERAEVEVFMGVFYESLEFRGLGQELQGEQLRAARSAEINRFRAGHWSRHFSHESSEGTPFSFPKCEYRSRCYKCRALYEFRLPLDTARKEKDASSLTIDERYPATQCAEVLAHIFCARKHNTASMLVTGSDSNASGGVIISIGDGKRDQRNNASAMAGVTIHLKPNVTTPFNTFESDYVLAQGLY
ncbi:MAG: hypothetical protein Q9187_006652 [Circinaria calcarea]